MSLALPQVYNREIHEYARHLTGAFGCPDRCRSEGHMAYVELQGTRLFYERQGNGNPPLVFVHGCACDHGDWQAQGECCRTRQGVVACDLRGHGASSGDPAHGDIETYGADIGALLRAKSSTIS